MPSSKNKTQPTEIKVSDFIKTLPEKQQEEAKILVEIFFNACGMKPVMWGNIFGFGSYHYLYDSGREGDSLATGFAMRKSGPTIYIMPGYNDYSQILKNLGVKYKLGKSCLYLKTLEGLDTKVLEQLIQKGLKDLSKIYPVK